MANVDVALRLLEFAKTRKAITDYNVDVILIGASVDPDGIISGRLSGRMLDKVIKSARFTLEPWTEEEALLKKKGQ